MPKVQNRDLGMKKIYSTFLKNVLLFFFLFTNQHAQIFGKFFSKNEADKLYGKVLESYSFIKTELLKIITETDSTVMFNFLNGSPVILGDQRKLLYPDSITVSKEEKFYLYSKSIVEKLISLYDYKEIYIEQRENNLTLTNGNTTLEESMICPPFCP